MYTDVTVASGTWDVVNYLMFAANGTFTPTGSITGIGRDGGNTNGTQALGGIGRGFAGGIGLNSNGDLDSNAACNCDCCCSHWQEISGTS